MKIGKFEIKPTQKEIDCIVSNKHKTAKEIAMILGIKVNRVYNIRAYIKYVINKEEYIKDGNKYNHLKFRKCSELLFLYEISSTGILRNVKSKRILLGTKDDSGYITFTFPINTFPAIGKYYGCNKKFRCHQLVMFSWGDEQPAPGMIIDHVDRNIYNNDIGNLRWVTKKENFHNSEYYESKRYLDVLSPYIYNPKRVEVDGIKFPSHRSASKYMADELHQSDKFKDKLIEKLIKSIQDRLYRRRKHIHGFEIKYL